MRFWWPFLGGGYRARAGWAAGPEPLPPTRSVAADTGSAAERAASGGAAGYSPLALARHNLGQVVGHLRRQGVPQAVIAAALRELAEGLE